MALDWHLLVVEVLGAKSGMLGECWKLTLHGGVRSGVVLCEGLVVNTLMHVCEHMRQWMSLCIALTCDRVMCACVNG